MIKKNYLILAVVLIFLLNSIMALNTPNQNRVGFNHVLVVENITTEPFEIIPGNSGLLKLSLYNDGTSSAKDVRVELTLPSEIAFLNDVSEKKISEVNIGNREDVLFNIIPLPKTSEGVYKANLKVQYINNVGEEREDNYSIGIVVKSVPKIFAQVEKSDIYYEKRTGDMSIIFTNNDVANIRFLTVELKDSEDYDILSSNKKYIGDLDSDDYQSVTFSLKVSNKVSKLSVPLKVYYKDSLNKDYIEDMNIDYLIRTKKELGIKSNNYYFWVGLIIIVVVIGVYFYRKNFKKMVRDFE